MFKFRYSSEDTSAGVSPGLQVAKRFFTRTSGNRFSKHRITTATWKGSEQMNDPRTISKISAHFGGHVVSAPSLANDFAHARSFVFTGVDGCLLFSPADDTLR